VSLELHPLRFRRGYYRRVEVALALALGVHVLVFAVAPPYVPRPYRLSQPKLRLVAGTRLLGGVSSEGANEVVSEPTRAPEGATPRVASSEPEIQSEQLRVSSGERGGPGTGGSGSGSGTAGQEGGSGSEDGPPVYYAFDSAPRVLRRVEPSYSETAKAQDAQGTVVLNANIDERGRVLRVWVVESTAPEILIQAATDALYQFEFAPGSQQGIPVRCTVAVPFRFTLDHRLVP